MGVIGIEFSFSMAQMQSMYDQAIVWDKKWNDANVLKKQAVERRNILLGNEKGTNSSTPGTLKYWVYAIKDKLRSRYRGEEMELGLWGYVVQR